MLVSSIALFQISSSVTQSTIRNFMVQYLHLNQEKVQVGVEFLLGEMNMLSVRLLTKPEIYEVIGSNTLDREMKNEQFTKILDDMSINWNTVGYISIVTPEGSYGYGKETKYEEISPDLIQRVEQSAVNVWGDISKDEDGNAYILLGSKYRDYSTGQRIGYLFIYVKERVVHDIVNKMVPAEWGDSLLVSSGRRVLSTTDETEVGSIIFDRQYFAVDDGGYKLVDGSAGPVIISNYQLKGNVTKLDLDWRIISIVTPKQLFEKIATIRQYSIFIQIGLIGLTFLAAWYVSKRIINPVNRLARNLRRFGYDDEKVVPYSYNTNNDEIYALEKNFNEMVVRINNLIHHINETKDQQRESELIALQAQINPHFLYNTLDAIGWIAKLNNQEKIEKMIIQLAKFYRLCLHRGDKFILVKEEIGIIESYTMLEKMRFPDKFSVSYEISEEIQHYRMLKLILQPLVENAIKHGIGPKRDQSHLIVRGYKQGEDIIFEIEDNGVGFETKKLEEKRVYTEYSGGGYGLSNVDSRIKLEYGKEYGISITSEQGAGTIARVRIKAYDYSS